AVNTFEIDPISNTLLPSRGGCPGPGSPYATTRDWSSASMTPTTMPALRFSSTRCRMIDRIVLSEGRMCAVAVAVAAAVCDCAAALRVVRVTRIARAVSRRTRMIRFPVWVEDTKGGAALQAGRLDGGRGSRPRVNGAPVCAGHGHLQSPDSGP